MAKGLKYYFAICLYFAFSVALGAQMSTDTLDFKLYQFDLSVVLNDSPTIQKLGPEIISELDHVIEPNYRVLIWLVSTKLNIHIGDLEQAKKSIKEVDLEYQLAPSKINTNTIAEIFSTKATLASSENDITKFESYLDSCLLILQTEKEPNYTDLAFVYQRLCYIYFGKGQVIKSIDYMRKADIEMKQHDQLNKLDSLILGNIFNDIAYLSNSTGNNDDVIPYYRLALQYNPTAWNIKLSLINNLRYEGDHKTAHRLVLEVIDEVGNDQPEGKAAAMLTMIAIIGTSEQYLFKNPEKEMLSYANKIVEVQKLLKTSSYPYDANSFGILCDYFRRVSKVIDYDKAAKYLKRLEDLMEEKGELVINAQSFGFKVNVLIRKAQLAWANKEYEKSEAFLKELITVYTGEQDPSVEEIKAIMLQKEEFKTVIIDYARMLTNKGSVGGLGGEYLKDADEKYRIVDSVLDSLLSFNESKLEINDIEELHKLGYGLAIKQYEATKDQQYLNTAYQRFEKLSTLTAFRHHQQSTLRYSNQRDTKLKREKNLLREELDILEGIVSEDESDQLAIEAQIDSLNKLFIGISENLYVGRSSYVNQTEKNKLASIVQLQSTMSENEVIYHAAHDRYAQEIYVLLISKDDVKTRVIYIESIRNKIDQLLASLSDPSSDDYQPLLQDFYKHFIQPIEGFIKDKKLVFIPGQDLALLPFGLLMDAQANYLCFKNPILYKYSSSWKRDRTESENKAGKFISFAVPSSRTTKEEGPDFLSAALKEVSFLKEEYGAELILQEKNPKAAFIEKSKEAQLLHVAVHSNLEPLNPIKSSLILSSKEGNDQKIYYHEIDDLALSADLVLLSSCQSGLSYPKSTGSVSSLARAFQLAGAKNLIQTTWSINDESTASLMQIFYNKLEEGNEVSTTLAEAKKEFLNQAPSKWQHPYYWGAFVLNGADGVVTIPKSSFFKSPTFLGIAAILVIFLFVFGRNRAKIEG